MPQSLNDIADRLVASGLLAVGDFADLLASNSGERQKSAEAFVEVLVNRGSLSAYQAECILAHRIEHLVLGNYVVLDTLGQGGMGVVLKARHRRMDRIVAIKMLAPQAVGASTWAERFQREVRAAAKLSHPNIVTAYDADESNGTHFLVMEYVSGRDLSSIVREQGPLSIAMSLDCIRQAARGLEYAHQQGIVHRDIKPGNLIVCKSTASPSDETPPEGATTTVKILDMGLARINSAPGDVGERDLTTTGSVMGTIDYMSPEQALDTKQADARSDVYSLGCSLHYLLMGRALYEGDTVMRRLLAHRDKPIPDLVALRSDVPAELQPVFQKMVAKRPEDRFQTMTEVVRSLAAVQAGLSRTAVEESFVLDSQPSASGRSSGPPLRETQVMSSPSLDTRLQSPVDQSRTPRTSVARSRWSKGPLWGGGVAVLMLIGAGIWWSRGDVVKETGVQQAPPAASTLTAPLALAATGWHGWPADAPLPAIAPFDVEQAKQHQAAWARYLKLDVEFTNSIGMKFVLIPPGEFRMGSTSAEIDEALQFASEDKYWQERVRSEAPKHTVILTQPIYLGIHEVTQAQYVRVMGNNPSYYAPMGSGKDAVAGMDTSSHPVDQVSWYDAVDFCNMLTEKVPRKPLQSERRVGETVTTRSTGYRLATEAEWEFACRAGTTTKYWISDQDADVLRAGWFGPNGYQTHVVGGLKRNPFGLYDMHGNITEWVHDLWEPNWYVQFQGNPALDPIGPSSAGSPRVNRGGSWGDRASLCRASNRSANQPSFRGSDIGFRVALTLAGAREAQQAAAETGWQVWSADAPAPAIAPFDAQTASKHQSEWATFLNVEVEFTNSIGMKFRLIPPGEFSMGSTPDVVENVLAQVTGEEPLLRELVNSEMPQHKVVLTQPMYLGVYEVTQQEYADVMGHDASFFSATGPGKDLVVDMDTSRHPAQSMSWNDAAEFCEKLNNREQLKSFYVRTGETVTFLEGTGYRLPTEAEWEYACRAGTSTRFWLGDKNQDILGAGWCVANSQRTHVVGELGANPFGLYDVHGNAWEWVQDWWGATYYAQFQKQPAIDPQGPTDGDWRVTRGGTVHSPASECRSAFRRAFDGRGRLALYGFRVALMPEGARELQKNPGATVKPITPSVD